jgi:hypothetical protein
MVYELRFFNERVSDGQGYGFGLLSRRDQIRGRKVGSGAHQRSSNENNTHFEQSFYVPTSDQLKSCRDTLKEKIGTSRGAACNPTLTIVTLAIRQADHIAGAMQRRDI